jgi:hypothetical protein
VDQKQYDEIVSKHGGDENVKRVDTKAGTVVLRKPTRAEYKRFRSLFWDEKRRSDAIEMLVRDCVAFPPKEAFAAMLEDRPGIADRCGNVALELAGIVGDDEGKD